jgi:hypothetical protein
MFSTKKSLLFSFTILFSLLSQARNNFLQQDTSEVEDCFEKFFDKAEKLPSPDKTIVITKVGKAQTVSAYMKNGEMGEESKHGLVDLDNDGKKELVIYNYSGGAHCCDQFFFFKNIAPDNYQLTAKTFAGNVCIGDKNEITFGFYEQFGYFFTCYACAYENTSDIAPRSVSEIKLKYNKGKLSVIPGDKELRSTINDNLAKLGEQPYQKLSNEIDQDNGLRKEVAFNLANFYYSFGKNITETKKLFDKYYKFPDAKKVWAEFFGILNGIKKDNSF